MYAVQEENEALQQLVLEVAANKKIAREKIASLKQDYNEMLREVCFSPADNHTSTNSFSSENEVAKTDCEVSL